MNQVIIRYDYLSIPDLKECTLVRLITQCSVGDEYTTHITKLVVPTITVSCVHESLPTNNTQEIFLKIPSYSEAIAVLPSVADKYNIN